MTKQVAFESERLRFRRWSEADKLPFAQMNADDEVMKYFPNKLTRAASDAFIGRIEKHFEEFGYGLWAVEVKETGVFIGYIGFYQATFEADFTPCIEIGWRLSRESWNEGYATEGAKACLDYGFKELKFSEVYSFTSVINIKSINVMKKIGLEKVGEFNHPRLEQGNPLRAHVVYKLEKEKYLSLIE